MDRAGVGGIESCKEGTSYSLVQTHCCRLATIHFVTDRQTDRQRQYNVYSQSYSRKQYDRLKVKNKKEQNVHSSSIDETDCCNIVTNYRFLS